MIFLRFFQCFCIPRPHWHNLASASVSKASWASLGSILGASWARLGRLGVVLGASWGRLGDVLWASWSVLGTFWETKKPYFSIVFSMFLRSSASLAQTCLSFRLEGVLGASWEHLGRVLGPSWTVMVASWGVLWLSWGVLWASWGRLGLPKSSQDRSKRPPRRLLRRCQLKSYLGTPSRAKKPPKPMEKQQFL